MKTINKAWRLHVAGLDRVSAVSAIALLTTYILESSQGGLSSHRTTHDLGTLVLLSSSTENMSITHIESLSQLNGILSKSKDKISVSDDVINPALCPTNSSLSR